MLWNLFVVFFALGSLLAFMYILFQDIINGLGIAMIICMILAMVSLSTLHIIDSFSYEEISQTGNYELVNITDDDQISGKSSGELFYVIEDAKSFVFYYKGNDNQIKIPKSDVHIYEKDDCIPHVEEYTIYEKNKINSTPLYFLIFEKPGRKSYKIYVPTGTIFSTFNLDV